MSGDNTQRIQSQGHVVVLRPQGGVSIEDSNVTLIQRSAVDDLLKASKVDLMHASAVIGFGVVLGAVGGTGSLILLGRAVKWAFGLS